MLDRFTMYPMAFITTVQPYLLGWVLAISFFITLAFVAVVSRDRNWKQILGVSLLSYAIVTLIVGLCSSMALGIHVMEVEFVWVTPTARD